MHTRLALGAPTSASVGERPSAPSTPRRLGAVDHRTVAAAVVAWKEKGEMSGMINVARQVIGLPQTQPGQVIGLPHREGRRTRAPSQERGSNQDDARPMEAQSKAAGARQRPPVIENRRPLPDSNDSDYGPTSTFGRRSARTAPAPIVLPRGDLMRRPKRGRSPSPTDRVIPIGAGPRAPAGPPPDHLLGNRDGREHDGRERPLETWQTFQHNPESTFQHSPESWRRVLNDIGIDINARRELFCLSQMGDEELSRAQDIIDNLLKKESNNDRPRNPSGFVHACVLNVQNDLGWGSTPWEPRDKRRRC